MLPEAATMAAVAAVVCLGAVLMSVGEEEVLMVDRGRNMLGRIGVLVHSLTWVGKGDYERSWSTIDRRPLPVFAQSGETAKHFGRDGSIRDIMSVKYTSPLRCATSRGSMIISFPLPRKAVVAKRRNVFEVLNNFSGLGKLFSGLIYHRQPPRAREPSREPQARPEP